MQLSQSRKDEKHDNLCEELLRERAAVLSRAGLAVEDALAELAKLDHEIQIKSKHLKSLRRHEQNQENLNMQQAFIEEINVSIEKFNNGRKRAQLKYYYLIVTREALGLRRHNRVQEIYQIPAKKKKIQDS